MYRALLHLYPASWRAEYGDEMYAIFNRRRREAPSGFTLILLWLEALADIFFNAAAVHFDLLIQDLRYALRTFRRSRGFALTAGFRNQTWAENSA